MSFFSKAFAFITRVQPFLHPVVEPIKAGGGLTRFEADPPKCDVQYFNNVATQQEVISAESPIP